MQFVVYSLINICIFLTVLAEASWSPTIHRFKRHCGNYGCGRPLCQECPSCCGGGPQNFNPVFNINFNCCSSPRPSPSCCPMAPVPQPAPCCGPPPAPVPPPCCPPPAPQPQSPIVCCKSAPVPENPCCQAVAENIPSMPSAPSCCIASPEPANPCCQPSPKPVPCTCSAPRPVPCRCGAPSISFSCPNCDAPPPRCSPMSPMGCSMRRMRRDVHQHILKHLHSAF